MGGPHVTPKDARTIRSRRLHYLEFSYALNLFDDIALQHASILRCNYQVAMYAAHLASGSSLRCRSIRTDTIKRYIFNVAKFIGSFSNRDIRKANPLDTKFCLPLQAVFAESSRWESQRDRREPFTTQMWEHTHASCDLINSPDSLEASLCDWFGCGLFAGFRVAEWAQPAQFEHIDTTPFPNMHGDPKAFCLGDIEFRGLGNSRLTLEQALALPFTKIERAIITFRTQKNGANGETRVFVINPEHNSQKLSFVRCMWNIIHRFVRHQGFTYGKPLCIHLNSDGLPEYITPIKIERTMRQAAAKVYNLDFKKNKAELRLWSSHSLRVGACVILHAMGHSSTMIQFTLRWRSMAFMDYLRNLAILSIKQNEAVQAIMELPQFL
jgi:hypothetical protein